MAGRKAIVAGGSSVLGYRRSETFEPVNISQGNAARSASLAQAISDFQGIADNTLGDYVRRNQADEARRQGMAEGLKEEPRLRSNWTEEGHIFNNAALNSYIGTMVSDTEADMATLEREANGDLSVFEDGAAKMRDAMLEHVLPEARPDVEAYLHQRINSGRARVGEVGAVRLQEQQRADVLDGIDALSARIALELGSDDPKHLDEAETLTGQLDSMIEGGVNSGLFTATKGRELRLRSMERAQQQVESARGSRVIDRVMGAYQSDVMAGDRALASVATLEGFTEEQKTDIQKGIRERLGLLRAERRRSNLGPLGDLAVRIATDRPDPHEEQNVLDLYRKGALDEGEYTSHLAAIATARERGARAAAEKAAALHVYNGSVPADPKDTEARKGVDALFAERTSGMMRGAADYQNVAVDVARRSGIVPSDAVAFARASIGVADTPELADQAAAAASLLRRLQEAAPLGYDYAVDERTDALVTAINDAVRSGAPADVAVAQARDLAKMSDTRREALEASYRTVAANNQGALRDMLNADDRYDRSIFSAAPPTPAALAGDFDSSVRRHYLANNGDLEAARRKAFAEVTRRWAYSTVNGGPELLPYAPEARGIPAPIVRADIAQTVKGTKLTVYDPETGALGAQDLDPARVRLVPTDATFRTSGVEWSLAYQTSAGTIEAVLNGKHQPVRYRLPTGAGQYRALTKQLAEQEIAKAREQTRIQRETLQRVTEEASIGDEEALRIIGALPRPAEGIKEH